MSRVPRVFCDRSLEPGGNCELPEKPSRHILKVLRLRPGDHLLLFDGRGREYHAELSANVRGNAQVEIEAQSQQEPEPLLAIHLVLGVSRGQRMDYALQKASELGVTTITPVFTERSVVRLDDHKKEQRLGHWRQVVISACEQSGRCRLPQVQSPQKFDHWLSSRSGRGILLDPAASDTLGTIAAPMNSIEFLVGPEGGLTSEEKDAARSSGYEGVRLGPRILRTETAPLAAIAAAQMLWGDFR